MLTVYSFGRRTGQLRAQWQFYCQCISQRTSHVWNDPWVLRLGNYSWTH